VEKSNPTIVTTPKDTTFREKQKQLKRYVKPLTVYGFTIFSNAAISFFTFSLLTHHLTEVDYGIISLYNSFIVLLMPFIGIGVSFVLNVDYFKMDREAYRQQFANGLVIPITSCLVFTLLCLLFQQTITQVTKVNLFFALIASFVCLLYVFNDIILNLIRNKEKYFLFAGYSFAKNITEAGLTILFVIGWGFSWSGRLYSNLISLVLAGLFVLFIIFRWRLNSSAISGKLISATILAGLPFIPERLAIFTLGYSDRFFIDYFEGTADVGYYGAGAQIALIVNLSILTLNNTFYPELFRRLSGSTIEHKKIKKIILMFVGISALITLCVIATIPVFFKMFIGPNFQPGKIYAINLSVGLFFWSIYHIFVAFLLNLKKNRLIMQISIFGMVLSVVLNFINVKQFGALGATYTSIIVYFSIAVVTIYFVNRYYNLKKIFM
jgi:O-antigen/teichoic acid export membrane protein